MADSNRRHDRGPSSGPLSGAVVGVFVVRGVGVPVVRGVGVFVVRLAVRSVAVRSVAVRSVAVRFVVGFGGLVGGGEADGSVGVDDGAAE